jgi:hypothetical protein
MVCSRCTSNNRKEFEVEMNFHFPGLEALRNPGVLMFLKVVVCLDCGSAEFAIPEGELPKLATRAAASHHS